jgi:hypothetical protein
MVPFEAVGAKTPLFERTYAYHNKLCRHRSFSAVKLAGYGSLGRKIFCLNASRFWRRVLRLEADLQVLSARLRSHVLGLESFIRTLFIWVLALLFALSSRKTSLNRLCRLRRIRSPPNSWGTDPKGLRRLNNLLTGKFFKPKRAQI